MPAKSQAQRGLIFARRDQYGSKKNTPKKWKWIWDEDWENKGKLPKRKRKKKKVKEGFVSASLEDFLNEVYYPETQQTDVLYDSITDELMGRGYTYQEADFAIDQVSDTIDEWVSEGTTLEEIGDYIDRKVFGIE